MIPSFLDVPPDVPGGSVTTYDPSRRRVFDTILLARAVDIIDTIPYIFYLFSFYRAVSTVGALYLTVWICLHKY